MKILTKEEAQKIVEKYAPRGRNNNNGIHSPKFASTYIGQCVVTLEKLDFGEGIIIDRNKWEGNKNYRNIMASLS